MNKSVIISIIYPLYALITTVLSNLYSFSLYYALFSMLTNKLMN